MSDLYRVKTTAVAEDASWCQLQVRAVNHDGQSLPDDPDFYFAVLVSMHWFVSTREASAAPCTYGTVETLPQAGAVPDFPLYTAYRERIAARDIRGFLRDDLPVDLSDLFEVEVLAASRDELGCAEGEVRVRASAPDALSFLVPGLELSTVFGEQGLDDLRYLFG